MYEISIDELQRIICNKWIEKVLSNWIEIVRKAFPDSEIINYIGSDSGRINGVLYEFKEKHYANHAPLLVRSYNQNL